MARFTVHVAITINVPERDDATDEDTGGMIVEKVLVDGKPVAQTDGDWGGPLARWDVYEDEAPNGFVRALSLNLDDVG